MIELVAFDWNGTLFADTFVIFQADNQALKAIGYPSVSFTDFLKHFDVPVKNYYLSLGIPKKVLDDKNRLMSDTFHKYYEQKAIKIRTRAHTRLILEWLKKVKIPAVIISNHTKQRIIEQTNRLKITHFFQEIIGNYEIYSAMHARNKKERFSDYLKTNKINPKDVILIGDSLEEIQIAKELGTLSAAITHGNVSTARLKAAKPDYLISDLGNLINIIREINSI